MAMRDPVIEAAQIALARGTEDLIGTLPKAIKRIIRERLWSKPGHFYGTVFESFNDFVTSKSPDGLDTTIDKLRRYCADDAEAVLLLDGEVGELHAHGVNQHTAGVDNINSTKGGTGSTYLLSKLKRDHPEIAQAYLDGEFPSVRQAAIAAGIVKVPTAHQVVVKALPKLTRDELQDVSEQIATELASRSAKDGEHRSTQLGQVANLPD